MRVYYVEDSRGASRYFEESVAEILDCEYRVLPAVEAAKSVILRSPPDLIFLDMLIPDNGPRLLQWIRGEASVARIPVVVVTSRAGQTTVDTALGLGARDVIEKGPRVATAFRRAIDYWLGDWRG